MKKEEKNIFAILDDKNPKKTFLDREFLSPFFNICKKKFGTT